MAYNTPQWEDDLSQPVSNPYSPLNPSSAPAPPPATQTRPISSTMPKVYHPPSTEKETLPSFTFPAAASHHNSHYSNTSSHYSNTNPHCSNTNPHYSNAPEVAFHDAPVVHQEHSYPIYAPGPAVQPSAPFYVGPGDLLVPAREGGTTLEPDHDPRVAAMEKMPKKKRDKGWWWLRVPLKWRWVIIAGLAVVVVGVAAGIAISMMNSNNDDSSSSKNGQDKTNDSDSTSKDDSSSTPPTTTTSPPLSATSFLSSPSTTPGPGSVEIQCPTANNTAWWTAVTGPTASGSTLTTNATLVRLCDRAYAISDADAVIRNTTALDFEACMGECAVWNAGWPASGWREGEAQNECVGVSWGFEGKQGTDENYCWLMKKVDEPGGSKKADWESALIVAKTVVIENHDK